MNNAVVKRRRGISKDAVQKGKSSYSALVSYSDPLQIQNSFYRWVHEKSAARRVRAAEGERHFGNLCSKKVP